MKRHNFGGLPASHGVSVSHRSPGSIGQRQTPGRVFPGKRMSGHMGDVRRTIENLQVVACRRRAQSAADSRRRAGCPGWPGHRASVREGGARELRARRAADQGRAGEEVARRSSSAMKLKLVSNGAQAAGRRSLRRHFRARIQRVPRAPGRHCLHGSGPCRHEGAEDQGRSARRRYQAVAPEGHRSGARGLASAARSGSAVVARSLRSRATSRRRSTARCIAARCARCSPSWRARSACRSSNSLELDAPKTKLLAQKLKDLGPRRERAGPRRSLRREARARRRATCRTWIVLPVSALDPLSLARHEKVLATVGAVRLLEERLA